MGYKSINIVQFGKGIDILTTDSFFGVFRKDINSTTCEFSTRYGNCQCFSKKPFRCPTAMTVINNICSLVMSADGGYTFL